MSQLQITEEKLQEIKTALDGLNIFQWQQIRQAIDGYFDSRVHESKRSICFEDSELLKKSLQNMPSFTPRQNTYKSKKGEER